MKKIVVKFGGSNLRTKEDIQRIVHIVKRYDRPLVIVVSAFYGITNYLLEGIETACTDQNHIKEMRRFLENLKKDTIDENISNSTARDTVFHKVSQRLEELEKYLLGIHYLGEPPPFVEDRILSYGERLSSLILASILRFQGINALEALPEQIGLVTTGEYRNSSVDFRFAESSVARALKEDAVYVVPGFYGVSQEGKITLLGRGGSDYSAAAIARCIDAESLDIWKDVDGYMTADPKIVPAPQRLEQLSYREAAELSYFGAQILHPRTVEPLLEKNIPIRIFNIIKAQEELHPLSIINAQSSISEKVIKSVTYSDNFAILKLSGPGVGIKHGVLAKVTSLLDNMGINIRSVVTSQTDINLYLDAEDLNDAFNITRNLSLGTVTRITPLDNLSIVALVGEGIMKKAGIADRMITAISSQGINIQIISLGASEVAAYVVVARGDREKAVQAAHAMFFS